MTSLFEQRPHWPSAPWMRASVILWGLLPIAYMVKVLRNPLRHSVYPIFEAATDHWWQRLPLYASYEGIDLFRYSPTFAVALTPFAVLPTILGQILWNFFGIALLLLAFRVLLREIFPERDRHWTEGQLGLFLFLTLFGSLRGIWSAQSNAHLLACAIFACAMVLRERWWAAAWLLAAAFFIKLWPIALLMLLAVFWPKKLLGRFAAAAAVLAAVPFLTGPPSYVTSRYVEFAESIERTRHMRWPGNRDAITIIETFGSIDSRLYMAIQLLTAAGVLGWLLWQHSRGITTQRLLTFTLASWAAWQLLFGPGTERLTYGLIAPFTAWAIMTSSTRLEKTVAWLAWLFAAVLGMGSAERALDDFFAAAPAIQPFGIVVFFVWLGIYGRNRFEEGPT